MGVVETLTDRNADFAATRFTEGLRMMPNLKTIVIGCVDPRVDPASVLGAEPGDIAAIRNVGGRVTRRTLEELVMLRQVTRAAGGDLGPGWELIVLQHTHCGITLLQDRPELLTPTSRPTRRGSRGRRSAIRARPSPMTWPNCAPRHGSKGCGSPGSSTTWPPARSRPSSRPDSVGPDRAPGRVRVGPLLLTRRSAGTS